MRVRGRILRSQRLFKKGSKPCILLSEFVQLTVIIAGCRFCGFGLLFLLLFSHFPRRLVFSLTYLSLTLLFCLLLLVFLLLVLLVLLVLFALLAIVPRFDGRPSCGTLDFHAYQ